MNDLWNISLQLLYLIRVCPTKLKYRSELKINVMSATRLNLSEEKFFSFDRDPVLIHFNDI